MTDPVAPEKSSLVRIHPKVALPVFAGSIVAVTLSILKTRWNIDLSTESPNLVIIVTGLVAYLIPAEDA